MSDHGPQGASPSETRLRVPLSTGTHIDHYVIHSVLGSGGFGITYLANHNLLGKLYAIKEYFPHEFSYREGKSVRPTTTSGPTYRWGLDRFLSEARALARFKHPAIVDVVSVFELNDTAYIVLAYEQGLDMVSWQKGLGRAPTQAQLDQVIEPLLGALEAMHARNLLHRDIAPDNVLIRDDGSPVLIDFGSARESIRGRSKVLSAIVKRGFSPPEQYSSRPELQGPWSDIYALAATLYRMITGKMPTDATERMLDDDLALLAKTVKGGYRPSFLAAIDRALRVRTADRPQSVEAWREELFQAEPTPRTGLPSTGAARGEPAAIPQSRAAPASRPVSRVQTGAERPKSSLQSERPDLSWIDEVEHTEEAPKPQSMMETPGVLQGFYGVIGLVCGAVVGALASIVLVSVMASGCSSDSCAFMFAPICSAVGGLAGLAIGVQLARAKLRGEGPVDFGPLDGRS